jgi:nucleoid-associated protein YgaU
MNKFAFKSLFLILLSLGVAAGCASQPADEGPTAEELEAQRAKEAAEAAARENRACLDRAAVLMEDINSYTGLNSDQQGRLDAAKAAMDNNEGCRARDLLSSLLSELEAASMTYTVSVGDSLWGIAGKGEVYGDSYQWPLIYKKNADKIEDADLIYPNQQFEIDTNPTESAKNSAINHARNRGAWSIGDTEQSDRDYLNR